MYSVPVYALRFAAHCRSRLRLSELNVAQSAQSSAISGIARLWTRAAPHGTHGLPPARCVPLRLRRALS